MYTKEEVEVFRNPSQYLEWFEALLNRTNSDNNQKKEKLFHEGVFKQFYEEIFPLRSLLKLKEQEWEDSRFKNVLGSQSFDVEIENNPLKFLEITCTNFDDGERFRMRELMRNGSVDGIGRIERNERGKPIDIINRGEMRRHELVIKERLESIVARIREKSEKIYPADIGLLLYFDDYSPGIQEDDKLCFIQILEDAKIFWEKNFKSIFLVGPKAEIYFEKWR